MAATSSPPPAAPSKGQGLEGGVLERLPSAGSFSTFCSRSLGSRAGFPGWHYVAAFVLLTIGLSTANGAFPHFSLTSTFDLDIPFLVLSLIIIAVAMTLSVRSIRTSVRVDLLLLGLEMFIFTLLTLICIVRAYGVLAWVVVGFVVYASLQRTAPQKLAALSVRMATDEIAFAGAEDLNLSSRELPHRGEADRR